MRSLMSGFAVHDTTPGVSACTHYATRSNCWPPSGTPSDSEWAVPRISTRLNPWPRSLGVSVFGGIEKRSVDKLPKVNSIGISMMA